MLLLIIVTRRYIIPNAIFYFYLSGIGCEQFHFFDAQIANFVRINVLLYAYDTIMLADSVKGLPNALNSLYQYCKEWSLLVNGKKEKSWYLVERNIPVT